MGGVERMFFPGCSCVERYKVVDVGMYLAVRVVSGCIVVLFISL